MEKSKNLKIHVGCGNNYFNEYTNIDLFDFDEKDTSRDGSVYDLKMDLTKLKFPKNSIHEILFIHGFEHFTKYQTIEILNKWFKILKPGGFLHLEMPDFSRVYYLSLFPSIFFNSKKNRYQTNIIEDMFYGNQWSKLDYETHRYLWKKTELCKVLSEIGYEVAFISNSTFFHVPFRDMIVICHKPGENKQSFKTRKINGKTIKINFFQNLKRKLIGLYHIFNFLDK